MTKIFKFLVLFLTGGNIYYLIETLWRGYSHFSMFILGGFCFILIGLINEYFTFKMPLWKQQLISAVIITFMELITGIMLNIWLGLNIWDYSNLKCNLLGQITLQYSILWFFLSLPGIILDGYLRYWLFDEEKPHYRYFI